MWDTNKIAFIYDYDGTLAEGNIQEASFLPDVGIKDSKEFWDEVKARTKAEDGDEILVYMQLMLEKATSAKKPLTRNLLRQHGKNSKLFPGLVDGDWFERMNAFASRNDFQLEHYIISSGVKEMLEGVSISKYFSHIWASEFSYDSDGRAHWPISAINYTTKTQFLFRINKRILNTWNNNAVNEYTPPWERPVPFERMVFFGDGATDVPTMKMLTHQGGTSIAVYQNTEESKDKVHSLIANGRAEYAALADYSEGSQIDIIAKGIVGRMKRKFDEDQPNCEY